MIITRTPFRISFAGGGSDIATYYKQFGGAVLSTSINKYVYLSIHPYFNNEGYLLKYSKTEHAKSLQDIEHKIIKQVFSDLLIKGVDFNSSSDIPSGTGLASSSAFTVGLLKLCQTYKGLYFSKNQIAKMACEIEIDKLKEPIGKQDQYACALGGLNFIEFNADETVNVEPIYLHADKRNELDDNLLMFYTGVTRSASGILEEQRLSLGSDKEKINNMHKMVLLARNLKQELLKNNIDSMGEILHEGWMYKKEMTNSISHNTIDDYYDLALKNGASGGKLLGAGGGGFLLFYVKKENQEKLRNKLPLQELKFKLDSNGASVIYYED